MLSNPNTTYRREDSMSHEETLEGYRREVEPSKVLSNGIHTHAHVFMRLDIYIYIYIGI